MITGTFGSLTKGLFNPFSRDSDLSEIKNRKFKNEVREAINILKNSPEYNARKEIRQNELNLEDKLGFWSSRVVKGNNIVGPGLAEMKYIKEHAGEGEYVPESLPAYNLQTTQRLKSAIAPGWSTTQTVDQSYSTMDRIKDLILGLALSNTPYSIPFLSRASGAAGATEGPMLEEIPAEVGKPRKKPVKKPTKKRRIWPYVATVVGIATTAITGAYWNHFLAPWSDSENDDLSRKIELQLRNKGVDVDPSRADPVVAAGYKMNLPIEMLKYIDNLQDEPNSYLFIQKLKTLPDEIINDNRILPVLGQIVEDNKISDADNQRLDNLDRDAFTNEEELHGPHSSILDVFRPNPAIKYALDKGLDLDIVKQLRVLDGGGLDENEKQLIDDIHYIGHDFIPLNIRQYYWADEEIRAIQQNLLDSALKNIKVSPAEVMALRYLKAFDRWNIQKDVINSGMINDAHLQEDWDGDANGDPALNNLGELKQGTNPLNSLETDPNNRSEVYIVSIGGVGEDREDNIAVVFTGIEYHLSLKSGIPKDHIHYLVNDTNISSKHDLKVELLRYYKHLNDKNILNDFETIEYYKKGEFSVEDVENASFDFSSKMDGNDVFILKIKGHGTRISDTEGIIIFGAHPTENDRADITNYNINKILRKMTYGRAIVFTNACYSDSLSENLDRKSPNKIVPLHDTLGIANRGDGIGNRVRSLRVWENLAQGQSLGEAEIYAYNKSISYYTKDGPPYPKCPWLYNFNPLVYLPENK